MEKMNWFCENWVPFKWKYWMTFHCNLNSIQFNSIHGNPYLQNFYKFNLPSGWWSFVTANWTVPSPTDTSEAPKSSWQKKTLDKALYTICKP
jgi:hypothetical protein